MIKPRFISDWLTWSPPDGGCRYVVFQVWAEELRGRLQVRSIHRHQAALHNVSTRTTVHILVTDWQMYTGGLIKTQFMKIKYVLDVRAQEQEVAAGQASPEATIS